MEGEDDDRSAEMDAARAGGEGGEEVGWVGDHAAVVVEMVLGDPDVVVAQLIEELYLLVHTPVELDGGAVEFGDVGGQIVGAETHGLFRARAELWQGHFFSNVFEDDLDGHA